MKKFLVLGLLCFTIFTMPAFAQYNQTMNESNPTFATQKGVLWEWERAPVKQSLQIQNLNDFRGTGADWVFNMNQVVPGKIYFVAPFPLWLYKTNSGTEMAFGITTQTLHAYFRFWF